MPVVLFRLRSVKYYLYNFEKQDSQEHFFSSLLVLSIVCTVRQTNAFHGLTNQISKWKVRKDLFGTSFNVSFAAATRFSGGNGLRPVGKQHILVTRFIRRMPPTSHVSLERVDSDSQDEFPMFKRRVGWESSDLKKIASGSALLYADEETQTSDLTAVFVAYDEIESKDSRFISRIPTAILVIALLIVPAGYIFGVASYVIPLPPPVSPLNMMHVIFAVHVLFVAAVPISFIQGVWAQVLLNTARVCTCNPQPYLCQRFLYG